MKIVVVGSSELVLDELDQTFGLTEPAVSQFDVSP